MDDDQLGEFAYDYVEVRRDYLAWTPAKDEPDKTESYVNPEDRHGIHEHSQMLIGHSPLFENGHAGNEHTPIQGDRHAEGVDFEKKA